MYEVWSTCDHVWLARRSDVASCEVSDDLASELRGCRLARIGVSLGGPGLVFDIEYSCVVIVPPCGADAATEFCKTRISGT